jgi:kynurenine formamidase
MARQIIDLTFPIHEGMTTFPTHWHPFVEISMLGRHGLENRETRKLVLGTHTGTHCDAPRHFIPGGNTIDRVPLEVLVGPATVVDFSKAKPNQEMQVADFEAALKDKRPERVIMRFDWCSHWGTMAYYTDHPFISEAAAQWLVDRGVRLLAMDAPMPDNPANGRGTANDSPNHKILLGKDVVLVEYCCNLSSIKGTEVELIVLPLKVIDGDGAPARVIAIEGSN